VIRYGKKLTHAENEGAPDGQGPTARAMINGDGEPLFGQHGHATARNHRRGLPPFHGRGTAVSCLCTQATGYHTPRTKARPMASADGARGDQRLTATVTSFSANTGTPRARHCTQSPTWTPPFSRVRHCGELPLHAGDRLPHAENKGASGGQCQRRARRLTFNGDTDVFFGQHAHATGTPLHATTDVGAPLFTGEALR
jgi:hypothetical protein